MRALLPIIVAALAVLPGPALAQQNDAAIKSATDKEKLICRREVPIGSLIASRKICMTKSQWQKRTEDGNAMARGLVEDNAGACGQNGGVCPFGT